jgi:hypothetical protein
MSTSARVARARLRADVALGRAADGALALFARAPPKPTRRAHEHRESRSQHPIHRVKSNSRSPARWRFHRSTFSHILFP